MTYHECILFAYIYSYAFPENSHQRHQISRLPTVPPKSHLKPGAVLIRGWCRRRHLARCCRMFGAGTAAKKKLSDSWRGTRSQRLKMMMMMTTSIFSVSMAFQSKLAIRNDYFEFWWCLITVDQFINKQFSQWWIGGFWSNWLSSVPTRELGGRWWNQRVACDLGMGGKWPTLLEEVSAYLWNICFVRGKIPYKKKHC